jgi:hypothetical protein
MLCQIWGFHLWFTYDSQASVFTFSIEDIWLWKRRQDVPRMPTNIYRTKRRNIPGDLFYFLVRSSLLHKKLFGIVTFVIQMSRNISLIEMPLYLWVIYSRYLAVELIISAIRHMLESAPPSPYYSRRVLPFLRTSAAFTRLTRSVSYLSEQSALSHEH